MLRLSRSPEVGGQSPAGQKEGQVLCIQKNGSRSAQAALGGGRPRKKAKKSPGCHSWVYVRQYCAEIDEAARNRMELIVRSLAEQNGVTEQLKADNQMEWVRQMNACKAQAEEIVKAELIYD